MEFINLRPGAVVSAYNWHSGFAAAKETILPRSEEQYLHFVSEGQVWAAQDMRGYAGLVYCVPQTESSGHTEWELGGLMVKACEKGQKVGSILARLALINTLVKEDPFRRRDKVIAHVLVGNDEPRGLIEGSLQFRHVERVTIPGDKLPGLKRNADGNVEGDVFMLNDATALLKLADWCDNVPKTLKDGRQVEIPMKAGFTFALYANVLRKMAADFVPF